VGASPTQAALKNFQRAEGVRETGRLDSETLTKLGVETTPRETRREKKPLQQKP
jgi:hypothetical protein